MCTESISFSLCIINGFNQKCKENEKESTNKTMYVNFECVWVSEWNGVVWSIYKCPEAALDGNQQSVLELNQLAKRLHKPFWEKIPTHQSMLSSPTTSFVFRVAFNTIRLKVSCLSVSISISFQFIMPLCAQTYTTILSTKAETVTILSLFDRRTASVVVGRKVEHFAWSFAYKLKAYAAEWKAIFFSDQFSSFCIHVLEICTPKKHRTKEYIQEIFRCRF